MTDPITRIREALDYVEVTRRGRAVRDRAVAALTELEAEREADRARVRTLETQLEEAGIRYAELAGDEMAPGFGCDPEDSTSLLRIYQAVDEAIGWENDEQKEAGDYVARVRQVGAQLSRLSAPVGDKELAEALRHFLNPLRLALVPGESVTPKLSALAEINARHVRALIRAAEKWQRLSPRIDAVERLFAWAMEHEEAAMPMPVFHRYMSKVDGGDCPQWRVQIGVKVEAFAEPWAAVRAAADALPEVPPPTEPREER